MRTIQPPARPRPLVIPVFLPHQGCQHRCAFCDQGAVTGGAGGEVSPDDVDRAVEEGLARARAGRSPVEIAFYGGNFLGLDPDRAGTLLARAARWVDRGRADGIRFSTRPDTVDAGSLARIRPFPVRTVELGVQSLDDAVLAASLRGHTAADSVSAARALKTAGYALGLQLMAGLPGQDPASALDTARRAAALAPDFVRIYPVVVLAGTTLARWWKEGRYRALTLDQAVEWTAGMLGVFRAAGVPVARVGLHAPDLAPESILAGPVHAALGDLAASAWMLSLAREELARENPHGKPLVIRVHPRQEGAARGPGNRNLLALAREFSAPRVDLIPDPLVPENTLLVLRLQA